MNERMIRIRGARSNNLKSLDLDVPRGTLTVFAGVSGSGKSSLVFDTIAAEAGHQVNETYPPFLRNRLPKWTRPEADEISGLSPVVVIDQRRLGGNARSTVGTVTDTWTYLRLLYSRVGEPHLGESNRFSFNDPAGMCPTCSGLGEALEIDVDAFLDLGKTLKEGAILLPGFVDGGYWHSKYTEIGVFPVDAPLRDWSEGERLALLYGGEHWPPGAKPPADYEGLVEWFERIYLRTSDNLSDRKREAIDRFTRSATCPDCGGERLNAEARAVTVLGRRLGELALMEVTELADFVAGVKDPAVAPVVSALVERLRAMDGIGLGYLHLGRTTTSLSGGESQRIKTVKHLGSSLIEMLYIFDEPTVGLHPHDVDAMVGLLERLRDKGNTVLVVEHDPAVMAVADRIVEIGPDAGTDGGRVVFQGAFDRLREADTPTARALARRAPADRAPREPNGAVKVADARRNNLQDVTVELPAGVLTVLTGVAGSGKSSLAAELVDQHGAVVVDQRPVSTNRRSTPVTYTGIAAPIRRLFAKASGLPAKYFSANSEGACPDCKGLGIVYTDLAFMDGQETVCETCGGRRFTAEALRHRVDGLTIADVDDLTIADALQRLPDPAIRKALRGLERVGLGYLRLGQPLTTLSGGECQRVKIAKELRDAAEPTLYVLDEPTTGLHLRDIDTLVEVLFQLVDGGHTVVVIEHNLDVIRRADWIVDMGPGAGRHGGRILYEGPVADMRGTATARALGQG
ncbi:ATP-binding cassette domain-containing protein [Glycomyces albidus]|uniref:UvrABC system protein A n=1 Tax=Glycomyces albidus TaxID=2656774 RepID=A0A6L5G8A7_9ACTN|nr:excinuclease ABC subunit UvrA [Glycomyces albidus]MQM25895.1 ATP-binding cassette domain-containing protein [Glycomyces albidus]